MNDEKINEMLKKWYAAKEQISKLEEIIDTCKTQAEYFMLTNKKTELTGKEFCLEVKTMTRKTVSKANNKEIWEKYAIEGEPFKCYRVMKAEEKNKRSPSRKKSVTKKK